MLELTYRVQTFLIILFFSFLFLLFIPPCTLTTSGGQISNFFPFVGTVFKKKLLEDLLLHGERLMLGTDYTEENFLSQLKHCR